MGNRKRSRNRLLRIVCLTVIAVCLLLIIQAHMQSVKHEAQQSDLKEMVETQAENFGDNEYVEEETTAFAPTEIDESQTETLSKYEALYEENQGIFTYRRAFIWNTL